MKIIDAHSHIEYISHNIQPDVVATICCATNESDWNNLANITLSDKNVYGAFGVHPWFVDTIMDGFDKRLYDLLKLNDSFMVGEIGLDKYRPNMEQQIDVFERQLNVAVEMNRAIFLHCVGAWDKILHVLKQYKKLPTIIAHDFNGNNEIMQNLVNNYDIMFSIHRVDKPTEIRRIEQFPIEKMLVESDAKPDVILHNVIDKISDIKKEPNAGEIIYKNTQRILQK